MRIFPSEETEKQTLIKQLSPKYFKIVLLTMCVTFDPILTRF